ncbi:MAG TPA: DinB family protein [Gemmatimonadales bacterium]|nr:DinB family protein [Gemmatimonadales bacterium]
MRPVRWLTAAALLALAAPAMAQNYIPRAALIAMVEVHKASALRYIDAAPDSMLGFRPTPGVRNFAQQIEHAVWADAFIAHSAITGSQQVPVLGDSAVYLHNKTALKAYAVAAMDHTIQMLQALPDAKMTEEITQFGKKVPRYRALMELLDHFPWTLGQTVPYLRLNGVTPPEYTPF